MSWTTYKPATAKRASLIIDPDGHCIGSGPRPWPAAIMWSRFADERHGWMQIGIERQPGEVHRFLILNVDFLATLEGK